MKGSRAISSSVMLGVRATLLALLVCELAARGWLHFVATPDEFRKYALFSQTDPQDFKWTPHPYLNYTLTPNFRNGLLSHNSLGYRGREFEVVKPAGVFRIVALGGSTVYTLAVRDNRKTFPSQLQRLLRQKYGAAQVEVINAGVIGYNSWQSLINLEFRVLDLDPDLVLLLDQGSNEVHPRIVDPDVYRSDGTGSHKQWQQPAVPWFERSCMVRIASRRLGFTHQVGLGPFIFSSTYHGVFSPNHPHGELQRIAELLDANPPTYFRRNLKSTIAVARANGVAIALATWAYSPIMGDYAGNEDYRRGFAETNRVVAEVAAEKHVALFDFAAAMPEDPKYWQDGRHMNENGVLLKAEYFSRWLSVEKLVPGAAEE